MTDGINTTVVIGNGKGNCIHAVVSEGKGRILVG